jgi:putative PIN family toxin of toxin-antitoxin system
VKLVLDTNVLVSGIFFGGVPRDLLDAWSEGRFELLLTPLIFDEYLRTCDRLAAQRSGLEYQSVLATIVGHGTLVPDTPPPGSITADPDDDKFMLCAVAHDAVVVSGDSHLLDASGWRDVRVLTPRAFLTELGDTPSDDV